MMLSYECAAGVVNEKVMVDADDLEKRARLERLGADGLIDALLELAERNEAAAAVFYKIVGTPEEKVAWAKHSLVKLSQNPVESKWFHYEIDSITHVLRDCEANPRLAIQTILSFFETEIPKPGKKKEWLCQVYWEQVQQAFAYHVFQLDNDEWVSQQVMDLFARNFDVGLMIIDDASKFLAPQSLYEMANHLERDISEVSKWSGSLDQYGFALESLAYQLQDAGIFERARRVSTRNKLSIYDFCDIAQFNILIGNAPAACAWMDRIPIFGEFGAIKTKVCEPLATFLVNKKHYLLATILYRRLFIATAESKARGCRKACLKYFEQLLLMSTHITEWFCIDSHESFVKQLSRNTDMISNLP
jgi:hypothetical protein